MEQTERLYTDFGYEILRGTLLPELLGNEEADILYWGGKVIARKYPLETVEDIQDFFHKAGWGELTILKRKKREMAFELDHPASGEKSFNFQLEAGFLAQQLEIQTGKFTETFIIPKKSQLTFQVHWDK
ncbi:YslB family protein [Alteribacillus sp. HJP-4]|uniref:YslB family protein n=1 Tax=Alteribacillus sp. HJP-4 TaxID=2775394 RepID=UPI0035CD132A